MTGWAGNCPSPKELSLEAGGSYLTVLIQEEVDGELFQPQGTIQKAGHVGELPDCLNKGGDGRRTGTAPRDYPMRQEAAT